ncbi:MAG: UDP-N-acetylmuramate dehydrogenase [Tidjanibacter sp.]|nr:UDP-N-acetylmuramate dehydrogenase [Tidjanibacter sp.]
MIRLSNNIDLTHLASFATPAKADRLIEWDSAEELANYLRGEGGNFLRNGEQWAILGEGCNTLFTKDFRGTIIRCVAKGMETIEGSDNLHTLLRVAAGEVWDNVVEECCRRSLWGAENLSAIPSSVGSSAVQNIGAYGTEAKDIIERVEYLDLEDFELKCIDCKECQFGYRDSIFKHALAGKAIITAVVYRLSSTPAPKLDYGTLRPEVEKCGAELTPMVIREAVIRIRSSKLPDHKVIGNAGSFFKNPILPRTFVEELRKRYPAMPIYEVAGEPDKLKIATGWMIDHLGWKGKNIGRAGVHTQQALVLVNLGGATGDEVVTLAERICREVYEVFGVEISPEVNIL